MAQESRGNKLGDFLIDLATQQRSGNAHINALFLPTEMGK